MHRPSLLAVIGTDLCVWWVFEIHCGFPQFGPPFGGFGADSVRISSFRFQLRRSVVEFLSGFLFFFVIFFGYRSARPGRINAD